MEPLKIKKMQPNATLPTRATKGSAGMDLYAALPAPLTLGAGEHTLIPTGIAIALPDENCAAFVFPRSGLAIKHGIGLLNSVGVIDSDYRGEIKVGVINQFNEAYTVEPGERIAQLVILPVKLPELLLTDDLGETERGDGGFGSTGTK